MYFIVYILEKREHVVVPYTWIKLDLHMHNIINNGINRGKLFEVFYTDNVDAFDNGIPRVDYQPNAHASLFNHFPSEGWYHCRIQKFIFNFREAMVYKMRRRNVSPKLYNQQRLHERAKLCSSQRIQERVSTFFRMNCLPAADNQGETRGEMSGARSGDALTHTRMDTLVDTGGSTGVDSDCQEENTVRD
ncbi:uncharacterized protein LOC129572583 [Sitodiplosis mosellana]|uniref:uncharacterized protein LOC129572583 n=1 Tax=Sitodiplosis mosellana TaxID=263140 RepID=UPI002443869C|nr:uncharacterized protein LOC129572583 [Sitodiplosis mosellana]